MFGKFKMMTSIKFGKISKALEGMIPAGVTRGKNTSNVILIVLRRRHFVSMNRLKYFVKFTIRVTAFTHKPIPPSV